MPQVFKRNVLEPVPTGAEIVAQKDGRVAKWSEAGKARKAPVVATAKGDRIVTGQSAVWMGKVKVGAKQRQVVRLYSDKTASERKLAELQKEADNRDAGVITPLMDSARRTVREHVEDYYLSLAAMRPNHQRIVKWMTERLIEWGNWNRLADINEASMRKILARLAADGATVSYQNKFITRAKAFVNYLLAGGKLATNPLATVKRGNAKRAKKTRARRPYDDGAIIGILDTAPPHRSRAYAFGYLAGMRRDELRNLTWGDLRLKSPIPFIQLREEWTKGSKADALPLHPYLLRSLGDAETHDPEEKVVPAVPDIRTLEKDLRRVGYEMKDAKDRRTDFHALRHTLATNLSRTGCSETNKSAIMRHTDETVTDGYSHARLAELADCIERLPAPAVVVAVAKTGTTDDAHQPAHQNAVPDGLKLSGTGASANAAGDSCHGAQARYDSGVDDNCLTLAGTVTDSVHNPSIDKNLRPSTQVD